MVSGPDTSSNQSTSSNGRKNLALNRHPSPADLPPQDRQAVLFEGARPIVKRRYENDIDPAKLNQLREQILARPFTDAQREMVQHVHGPLLVLAGPGSGKTHSATNQALHLVSQGVRPGRILAVTFTKKAAEEFRDRCRATLRFYTKALPDVCTMNSLGYRILRENGDILGFKRPDSEKPCDIRVVDKIDAYNYLQRGVDALPENVRRNVEGDRVKWLREQIDQLENAGIDPIDARNKLQHDAAEGYIEFQKWCQDTGCVTFNSQLRLPSVLFTRTGEAGAKALEKWQSRWDFIIVDEYQDTNQAQEDLLVLLAQGHRNISVVGDDDQAIYGFRGAEVEHIRAFANRWRNTHTVRLEANFRSTPEILEPQNKLILASREERHQKTLTAIRPSGPVPQVGIYEDELEEAHAVAELIKEKIDSKERKPGDFAVLVRDQYRAKIHRFEEALVDLKIPYASFFNTQMEMGPVKRNAYSMLAAIHEPKKAEGSFLQLLTTHTFALEDQDLRSLLRARRNSGKTIWELIDGGQTDSLAYRGRDITAKLRDVVKELNTRARSRTRTEPLAAIARDAYRQLYPQAAADDLWNNLKTFNDTTIALRTIVKNLDAFESSPKTNVRNKTLASFINWQLVEIPRRIQEGQAKKKANEDRKYVSFMSLHASKGLEFPVVVLPAFIQSVIPHEKALPPKNPWDDHPLFPRMEDMEDFYLKALEEERRLAFVGGTRAKDELYYTLARYMDRDGRPIESEPSDFLYDMGLLTRAV